LQRYLWCNTWHPEWGVKYTQFEDAFCEMPSASARELSSQGLEHQAKVVENATYGSSRQPRFARTEVWRNAMIASKVHPNL
jgi:hypothetical protein